jgi:hypothetical protein
MGFLAMTFEEALETVGWTPEDVDLIIPIDDLEIGRKKTIPE